MRPIEKAGIILFIAAGGLAWLADYLKIARMLPIALGLFGILAIMMGMNTVLKGRLTVFDRSAMRHEFYSGAPAYLLGSAVMFIGAGLVFYAVWVCVRPEQAAGFLENLVNSPQGWGLLLLSFGFFTFVFGVVRLVAGSAYPREQRSVLTDMGFRLEGVIGMTTGIILVIGGFWLAMR